MAQNANAEPMFQRSLEILESKLGKDYPSTATVLNNLAKLYDVMGQFDKAEPLYLQSLYILKARLGKHDPQVKKSLANLVYFNAQSDRVKIMRVRCNLLTLLLSVGGMSSLGGSTAKTPRMPPPLTRAGLDLRKADSRRTCRRSSPH